MRLLFWLLALAGAVLLGYLLHEFIGHRKAQVETLDYGVSAREIEAYRVRAESLKTEAEKLRVRLEATGRLRRPAVRQRLELLLDEIAALERTIEMWYKSKRLRSDVDLVRQTILLYGEASAAARALAGDTLPDR
ncbi:MAG: hypothetical protein ABIL25_02205 [candidate division WOR-3 bacterium]